MSYNVFQKWGKINLDFFRVLTWRTSWLTLASSVKRRWLCRTRPACRRRPSRRRQRGWASSTPTTVRTTASIKGTMSPLGRVNPSKLGGRGIASIDGVFRGKSQLLVKDFFYLRRVLTSQNVGIWHFTDTAIGLFFGEWFSKLLNFLPFSVLKTEQLSLAWTIDGGLDTWTVGLQCASNIFLQSLPLRL